MKKIGIIGGMGPEATSFFYMEIIRIFQKKFGAKYDGDYPEMIIYNLPLPDIVECLVKEEEIVSMLSETAKKLESMGADFLVMPCNTAHQFFREMENSVSIPILNIVEETMKEIGRKSFRKIGILATKSTAASGIYKRYSIYGMGTVFPDALMQEKITEIIMNILAGKKRQEDRKGIREIIRYLVNKGAEGIVLGCTELPLLIKESDSDVKIFDTIKILAESTVDYAVNNGVYKRSSNGQFQKSGSSKSTFKYHSENEIL